MKLLEHHAGASHQHPAEQRDGQYGRENGSLDCGGEFRSRHVEHELLALGDVGGLDGQLHVDAPEVGTVADGYRWFSADDLQAAWHEPDKYRGVQVGVRTLVAENRDHWLYFVKRSDVRPLDDEELEDVANREALSAACGAREVVTGNPLLDFDLLLVCKGHGSIVPQAVAPGEVFGVSP